MRASTPVEVRVFHYIDATGPCWLWTGATNRGGYGVINRGRTEGAAIVHRLVWQVLIGPVPPGLELDHLCRVRSCCNPDHLEPVTRAVNVARGAQRAGAPRGDSCRGGHPFTPENTVRTGRGTRTCRICKVAANRRYRIRKQEEA